MTVQPRRVHVHKLASAMPAIREPSEFWEIIKQERGRTDRHGKGFALVVFEVGEAHSHGSGANGLGQRLAEEARSIDTIGWLDDRTIGVLLTSSSAEGGGRFVHRLSNGRLIPDRCLPFTVHSYPECWGLPAEGARGLRSAAAR